MARDQYVVEYRKKRLEVLARDGCKCVKCGSLFSLEVHHIDGHTKNEIADLVTLCYLCHGIAPMGSEFKVWLESGQDGTEQLRESLAGAGIEIERDALMAILEHLDGHLRGIRRHQLLAARTAKRNSTGRCEGRLPYGAKPGEAEGLRIMKSLRDAGRKADEIAEDLNARFVPTRGGVKWRGSVVRKILARHSI